MVTCEKDVAIPLDDASLINNEDAEPVVLLPSGGRLRLEWQDDQPEIDATVPMEAAIEHPLASTSFFDE